jgi:hypothetical protein
VRDACRQRFAAAAAASARQSRAGGLSAFPQMPTSLFAMKSAGNARLLYSEYPAPRYRFGRSDAARAGPGGRIRAISWRTAAGSEGCMNTETVKCRIADHVAVVTMDRPPVNAQNAQMNSDMALVFDWISDSDDVRVAVLTGAGKAFSAGADIKDRVGKERQPGDAWQHNAASASPRHLNARSR